MSGMSPTGRTVLVPIRIAALVLLLTCVPGLLGQTPAQPATASVPVVESPTLITDHEHRPVGDFHVGEFKVKIGPGEAFTPLAIRKEGTDPLSLIILLDASRDSFHDLSQIGDDLAALTAGALDPLDQITLYAFDCKMVRSMLNAPPDGAALHKAVTDALGVPALHDGQKNSACGKTVHLWDDVAVAVSVLSHRPGRRVIVLVSGGRDGGSKYDWKTVQQYAFDQSVAIFGLRDQRFADADDYSVNSLSTSNSYGRTVTSTSHVSPQARAANDFELLCANSGGLTLSANPLFRKDALADILFLVRSRLILTAPKDAYSLAGDHGVKVTLPALTPYYISPTGASDPVPSP
jgi:hypothetical protein